FPGTQIGPVGAHLTAVPPVTPTVGVPRTTGSAAEAVTSTAASVPSSGVNTVVAGSGSHSGAVDQLSANGDVIVTLAPGDGAERNAFVGLVLRERDTVARA